MTQYSAVGAQGRVFELDVVVALAHVAFFFIGTGRNKVTVRLLEP